MARFVSLYEQWGEPMVGVTGEEAARIREVMEICVMTNFAGISAEAGCLLEYAARNPIPADAPEEQLFMVGGREATSEELDELLEPTLVELDELLGPTLVELDELLEATLVELRHSEPVRPDVVIGPRKGEAIQDGGSGKASSEGAA